MHAGIAPLTNSACSASCSLRVLLGRGRGTCPSVASSSCGHGSCKIENALQQSLGEPCPASLSGSLLGFAKQGHVTVLVGRRPPGFQGLLVTTSDMQQDHLCRLPLGSQTLRFPMPLFSVSTQSKPSSSKAPQCLVLSRQQSC